MASWIELTENGVFRCVVISVEDAQRLQSAIMELTDAMSSFANQVEKVAETIAEALLGGMQPLMELDLDIFRPKKKLPRAPQRIDAPRARRNFDRRPPFHHARSTI